MAVSLTVQGTTFQFPQSRESPEWGEEVQEWASAVTTAISNFTITGDIALTSATLADNQSSAANVVGLAFSAASVRAGFIEYSIIRGSNSEAGQIIISYNGTSWNIMRSATADTGITFTITNAGQVQYTSTSTGSNATMKFRARVTTQ